MPAKYRNRWKTITADLAESHLRDFMRSYDKMSYAILNRAQLCNAHSAVSSGTRGPILHRISQTIIRLCKVWNRWDIWRHPQQQWCRDACQMSEVFENSNHLSRTIETLCDPTIRRLMRYWIAPSLFMLFSCVSSVRCMCREICRISVLWYRDQETDSVPHKIAPRKNAQSRSRELWCWNARIA